MLGVIPYTPRLQPRSRAEASLRAQLDAARAAGAAPSDAAACAVARLLSRGSAAELGAGGCGGACGSCGGPLSERPVRVVHVAAGSGFGARGALAAAAALHACSGGELRPLHVSLRGRFNADDVKAALAEALVEGDGLRSSPAVGPL